MVDGTSPDMWGSDGSGQDAGRGQWLRDSRFAMFIHWGPYATLAGKWQGRTWYGISEWIMKRAQIPVAEYEAAAAEFNPTAFDAREWVALAKAAGMRHIMITAKHHDGFAMFKSAVSLYNIVDHTPFGRDPLAELAAACAEAGLRLGFYYSQSQDWHERDAVGNTWDWSPEGADFEAYLHGKAIPQLKELLTNYGPIAGVWFDTPGPITPEQSAMLVDLVHELQPDCLVNSRIGNSLGDYDTLGDQEIPALPRPGLWETCDTHNDTWGYAWYDRNFKSPRELAWRLARVVSRGGTYLLNVGPDGLGRIPADSAAILRQVGRWVQAHQDALHGAGPTPLGPLPWGECTTRDGKLYLHIAQWPVNRRLPIPGLRTPVRRARLADREVPFQHDDEAVVLDLPAQAPDSLLPVVELDLSRPVEVRDGLYVLSGCVNTLAPGLAAMAGCEVAKVRWMEKFGDWHHADCLVGWQGPGSTASWRFRTIEPGSFSCELDYTCPAEGDDAEWHLRCDDLELGFPLIDTGERERRRAFGGALPRFRTHRLGLLVLPAGDYTLSLGPVDGAGLAMRLSAVRLSPI